MTVFGVLVRSVLEKQLCYLSIGPFSCMMKRCGARRIFGIRIGSLIEKLFGFDSHLLGLLLGSVTGLNLLLIRIETLEVVTLYFTLRRHCVWASHN